MEQVKKNQTDAVEQMLTAEEKAERRKKEIEFMSNDLEYLKLKAEYEECIARIEIALRNQTAAFRDRIIIQAEMKQGGKDEEK